jgi:hypothetical protein
MTAPPVRKRGLVSLSAVLVVVLVGSAAHAEVVFRKKAPAPQSGDDSGEASPSGGEPGTEGAPAGEAADKTPGALQAEDKDTPEAQAQRDKARADAALARQMKNAELSKHHDEGVPFYTKWQFWAIAGGVLVGGALAIWGGSAVWHQMQGGDVRACPVDATTGCFGEGR